MNWRRRQSQIRVILKIIDPFARSSTRSTKVIVASPHRAHLHASLNVTPANPEELSAPVR